MSKLFPEINIFFVASNLSLGFLIASFMSLDSLKTLFTAVNSSWITSELINILEINTSIVFNLVFANNTISSFFFLIIDLYFLLIDLYFFLITAVITEIFNYAAELTIPIRIPTNEAKAENKTHRVTAETKTTVQCNLKLYKPFCASSFLIKSFCLIFSTK